MASISNGSRHTADITPPELQVEPEPTESKFEWELVRLDPREDEDALSMVTGEEDLALPPLDKTPTPACAAVPLRALISTVTKETAAATETGAVAAGSALVGDESS